jgi:hypothetical protein
MEATMFSGLIHDHLEAARRGAEGGTSVDATGHRGGEEEKNRIDTDKKTWPQLPHRGVAGKSAEKTELPQRVVDGVNFLFLYC